MAKKVMLMKLLEELRGYENVTNRQPTQTPMLYLMQLRQRNSQAQVRRTKVPLRLAIATDWQNPGEAPAPIKIHHAVADACDLPVVIG